MTDAIAIASVCQRVRHQPLQTIPGSTTVNAHSNVIGYRIGERDSIPYHRVKIEVVAPC